MKTCPICQAVAFDDAAICFGCMYRFEDAETDQETLSHKPSDTAAEPVHGQVRSSSLTPPAFYIKMVPETQESGAVSWACSIDFATV